MAMSMMRLNAPTRSVRPSSSRSIVQPRIASVRTQAGANGKADLVSNIGASMATLAMALALPLCQVQPAAAGINATFGNGALQEGTGGSLRPPANDGTKDLRTNAPSNPLKAVQQGTNKSDRPLTGNVDPLGKAISNTASGLKDAVSAATPNLSNPLDNLSNPLDNLGNPLDAAKGKVSELQSNAGNMGNPLQGVQNKAEELKNKVTGGGNPLEAVTPKVVSGFGGGMMDNKQNNAQVFGQRLQEGAEQVKGKVSNDIKATGNKLTTDGFKTKLAPGTEQPKSSFNTASSNIGVTDALTQAKDAITGKVSSDIDTVKTGSTPKTGDAGKDAINSFNDNASKTKNAVADKAKEAKGGILGIFNK